MPAARFLVGGTHDYVICHGYSHQLAGQHREPGRFHVVR